jgi:polar amino acid transport system permease protein
VQHYWMLTLAILPFLGRGFLQTFVISLIAGVLGSALGGIFGIIRSQRVPVLTTLLGGYIHLLRGTPFLVQLYLFYFVLPNTGLWWLKWDSETAAWIALSIYTSSYVCEIVRASIEAVPRGQSEGAIALGLGRLQRLGLVILPQALKLILPPMSGVYVMIIKSTAVLSVVGISELTRQGEISIVRFPHDILFIYGVIAVIYFLYCYPVLRLTRWMERRIGKGRVPQFV